MCFSAEADLTTGLVAAARRSFCLQCTVTGTMEPLLEALLPSIVVTLDPAEMSLEEVFLSQSGQRRRPAQGHKRADKSDASDAPAPATP